jgi:membrane fusion protein, multidrug efflux system
MSDVQQEPAGSASAASNGSAQEGSGSVIDKSRRRPLLIGVAVAVLVIGLGYLLYNVLIGSRSVSTDNAYVAGENAQVTPLTSGQVVEVAVIDTQPVRRGQMLLRLDDQDQKLAVQQAEAALASAQRRFTQSRAQGSAAGASAQARVAAVPAAQARLVSAQADLERARAEYQRRAALDGSGAVSAEDMSRARNTLAAAQAAVQQAQAGRAPMSPARGRSRPPRAPRLRVLRWTRPRKCAKPPHGSRRLGSILRAR